MRAERGADRVARRLFGAGCRFAFGIPGGEVLALMDALDSAGLRFVLVRHENAGGFMAFGFADLPPIRQFGMLAALAFVLSMIADFTALPAALWILFRERPADR